jgi:hypothetical protein
LTDGEWTHFVAFAPAGTSLQTLVTIAGMRWTIEECFEVGKNGTGLDEYEVRHWPGWYRHITPSILALAFLSVTRCQTLQLEGTKKQVPWEDDLLPFTMSEIRRLVYQLVWKAARSIEHILAWSVWRRRHQARAKMCHYRRRQALLPTYLRL